MKRKSLKKMIFIIICISIIFGIGIVNIANHSTASESAIYINLGKYKDSDKKKIGYGNGDPTESNGNYIWEINQYNSNNTNNKVTSPRNLYCIKAEYGTSWTSASGGENNIVEYNLSYDFEKQKQEILNKLVNSTESTVVRNLLTSEKGAYNELLWILDNAYIPGETDKKEYLSNLNVDALNIVGNEITDDDIIAMQKMAIWYFTNYVIHDDITYTYADRYTIYDRTQSSTDLWLKLTDNAWQGKRTIGEGTNEYSRAVQTDNLYKNLVQSAINGASEYNTTRTSASVNTSGLTELEENKYKLSINKINSNYIIGPIKLNGNIKTSSITLNVKDSSGNAITDYKISNVDGVEQNKSLNDYIGNTEGFYIKVPTSVGKKVSLEINIKNVKTNKTLWLKGKDQNSQITLAGEQPLVEITRTTESLKTEFEAEYKEFDLALRKYIVEVNGKKLTDLGLPTREPNIDTSTLKTGTTATYNHRKNPVVVKENDIVTYSITVYNEGDIDGYANQITDQLPTNLVISQDNSSTITSVGKDGNTKNNYILKSNISNNSITFENTTKSSLKAYSETIGLDYETLTFKCKVIQKADNENNKILTNVAWISDAKDSSGNSVTDRDSSPSTSPNVNKDNMENYKGNTSNKENLNDSNYYYKGEQDDDDFEKLRVKPLTQITITKNWDDSNNQDGKRPTEIIVQLLANGKKVDGKTLTLKASENWTGKFIDLSVYDDDEQKITYTISEPELPSEYTDKISGNSTNGFVITNSYIPETTSISVIKKWKDSENQDGMRPTEIIVQLLADGEKVNGKVLTLKASENWSGKFTNLPVYKNGKKITYTILEPELSDGYNVEIIGDMTNGFTITNSYTPKTIDIPVTKTWNDSNNQDGKRPTEITIQLFADGEKVEGKTLTLKESENWAGKFTGLPVYKNGQKITYTISEITLPDGYSKKITGDMNNGFIITNSYTPGVTSIPVTKAWSDSNDQDGKRPTEITVQLFANGEKVEGKTLTLKVSENWSGTFVDLPIYKNGQKIKYTVSEVVPDEYTNVITGDASNGFVITNTYTPETIDIPVKKYGKMKMITII